MLGDALKHKKILGNATRCYKTLKITGTLQQYKILETCFKTLGCYKNNIFLEMAQKF